MGVEAWKELSCSQCESSDVFLRAKDLADHKLEVHGPTKEQLCWAVENLHGILHGLFANQYLAVTTKMYDEFAKTNYYANALAAVNHKIVQRVVGSDG